MSEYQYYEFCSLHSPLSSAARKEMRALSSRACVTTHTASYVYNYGGDFRGKIEELLLKYFDMFFYISKYGTIRLLFKYLARQVDKNELKQYCIEHVIRCETQGAYIVLDVEISHEEGFGWIEGEGLLSDFLPLYDEMKAKNYQFLRLAVAINDELTGKKENAVDDIISQSALSSAQAAFLNSAGLGIT